MPVTAEVAVVEAAAAHEAVVEAAAAREAVAAEAVVEVAAVAAREVGACVGWWHAGRHRRGLISGVSGVWIRVPRC